jgi:hypothetical protein
VDRQKGVEFVEPAMISLRSDENEDKRLDDFFARKG